MKRLLLGVMLVMGMATASWALPVTFDLVGVGDANNQASVLFAYDPSIATVSLDISNTSGAFDPRLTSFAFNAPAQVTGASFDGPSGWSFSYDPNDIDTPGQFALFDVAGLTGPNFNGGSPNFGIPPGSTYSFSFALTGTGLSALTEMSFLSLLSFDAPQGPDESEQYFIARFQGTGANGQGSDVAIPTGAPEPVPEPGTILLLGSGFVGLAIYGRRRKKA